MRGTAVNLWLNHNHHDNHLDVFDQNELSDDYEEDDDDDADDIHHANPHPWQESDKFLILLADNLSMVEHH